MQYVYPHNYALRDACNPRHSHVRSFASCFFRPLLTRSTQSVIIIKNQAKYQFFRLYLNFVQKCMHQWHSFVSGREELRIICMIHLVQCAWGLIKSTLMFTLCGVIFATKLALVVHTAYIPWHWVASASAAERVFSAAVCGHAFKAPTITISLLLSQPLFQLRRFSQSLQCAPFQAATSKIGRVFTKSENWWLAQWWIVLIIQI